MPAAGRGAILRFGIALGVVAAAACVIFGVHVSSATASTIEFEGHRFDLVRIDGRTESVELHWRDEQGQPLRDFKHLLALLERQGKRPAALTNAGIFSLDFQPLGLHVERGRELHPLNLGLGGGAGGGNFFLAPNGVFLVDRDGFSILESHEAAALGTTGIVEGTQSGPLLVHRGALHPELRAGSSNLRLRSGIGVRSRDEAVIALSRDEVNFDTFARLFRDRLACPDALFLDGDISGLWTPSRGGEDLDKGPFTAIIAVVEKETAGR